MTSPTGPDARLLTRVTLAQMKYATAGDDRAAAIRDALAEHTYREVAAAAGVSLSTICKLEKRKPGTRSGKPKKRTRKSRASAESA